MARKANKNRTGASRKKTRTAADVLKTAMPDMETVETPPERGTADSAPSSGSGRNEPFPSAATMEQLRATYLGEDTETPRSVDAANHNDVDETEDGGDVEVLQVRPKRSPADPADDPGPRTVIFSKTRGVHGVQG